MNEEAERVPGEEELGRVITPALEEQLELFPRDRAEATVRQEED